MQPIPEGFEQVSAPGRAAANKRQGFVFTGFGWKQEGILGAKKAAQAVDQPLDSLDVQLILAAKGVDDLGLGKAFLGVPGVVGELDVFDAGAVLCQA
jgi:hypothetical protein